MDPLAAGSQVYQCNGCIIVYLKFSTGNYRQNRGRPPNPITVTFRVRFMVRNRVRVRFRVRDRVRNRVRWSPTVLPKL